MKKIIILSITLSLIFSIRLLSQDRQTVKVACIGNSITYGAGIKDNIRDAWPPQLGRMLGDDYIVRNFGYSGRTLLQKGNYPYMQTKLFYDALRWNPDIVIIMLGTNDSKSQNWRFKDDFTADYNKIILSFDTLSSNPVIYLAAVVPVFKGGMIIDSLIVRNEVNPLIKRVAKEHNLHLIDLYTPMLGMGDHFPDAIHPDAVASGEMAKIIYKHLTGKEGVLINQIFPGKKSVWKSFDKYGFEFYGRPAQIVVPEKPLEGKPWVWRARFPDWHTEMDSILLSEGYYVVFVNTNAMFGSPGAMAVWDRFYNYLTGVHGFSPKVNLEGVSRGGLYVYNWAKRHPDRVNAIYAEAPVCDLKSWPGGFGAGKGSQEDWEVMKKVYGFVTDEEAKAFNDNPVDNLDTLAKAKVPLLNMIGLNDSIVPVDENTMVLVNRYIRLGGIATVVPCTEGKQQLWGHHFEIESPRFGADFIEYYTELPKAEINPAAYHELRDGIRNSVIKFERDKKGRVAFLGGSITYNPGWRDSICEYLQKRFPGTKFDFIAAGIPSMGSTCDAFRLERDILKNGPVDLLFVEAAVNDGGKGRSNEEQIRSMEGIVRHIRNADPSTDIVFMYFVDPGKIETYRKNEVPQVIQNHDKVAKYYKLPAINLAKEVTDRIDAGEFTWKDDFKNLHPSPFGQGVYARSMISFLNDAWSGFVADDDKVTDYQLPARLDPACYDNGVLIPAVSVKSVKGWTKVENWIPQDSAWTRHDYVKVPMLAGRYPGKTLKFEFDGNAVGIAVAAGPDAGVIEYKIDKGEWEKQDLFTKHSTRYHLPWYYTLAYGLTDGEHVLQLRLTNEKNPKSIGNVCRIRYFFVNKTS